MSILSFLILSILGTAHCFASPQKHAPIASASRRQMTVAQDAVTYEPKFASAMDHYHHLYQHSINQPNQFWSSIARHALDWVVPFRTTLHGTLKDGNVAWFPDGYLNVCYNAVDRHAFQHPHKIAMIWEGDEPDQVRSISYQELLQKVSQIANALQSQGVKKGDVVTIYMPMIPELPMTMLACARLGAVHSVVFAGFSAEALASRVSAAQSKYLVTSDIGKRGGKTIQLKNIVNEARTKEGAENYLKTIFVWEHAVATRMDQDTPPPSEPSSFELLPKDVYMDALVAKQRPYCPPTTMNAEDNLFILYTSGSTGMPKGLVHTTGGYAVYAAFTTKTTFDLADGDIFACVADCGWITGHTYVVYGPLLNGATTFLFESTPLYPDAGRYWDMIQRHKITQFYTAPTAIRSLMQHGSEIPQKYDLSSLKILGSVGEPINPEAWRWYYEFVGKKQCTIVDTYWQTETVTNLPSCTPMKPGSCTLPFYGVDAVVLDAQSGQIIDAEDDQAVDGVLAIRQPWPGMARTCLGDHERYMTVYLKPYPGYYFTGDSVTRDKDGYHFITGRVDDVINVSGHRIGTAEVESALVLHPAVAQAAVIGTPHPIKGEAIVGFCMLDNTAEKSDDLIKELVQQIRSEIGAFASPDQLYIVPTLPMTRSGKIMRRILRKIVAGEAGELGDVSTLADPSIVETLIDMVGAESKK